jgi:hypothetical protein
VEDIELLTGALDGTDDAPPIDRLAGFLGRTPS